MTDVVALLEQERAKVPKEIFYARRPPYPPRILSKPYLERYEPRTLAQYDGKRGSAIKHVSLLTPSALTQQTRICVFKSFPNSYVIKCIPGTPV